MAMDDLNKKAQGAANKSGSQPKSGGMGETIRVIIEALLIAVVIRTFAFQPFNIPSGSLIPTLLVGDYLFVSKYAYGYSKHSFPFSLGPFSGRVWGAEPKRGDIAVFKLPKDNETDYIKRVIGMPGDRIQMIGGLLHINGEPVKKQAAGNFDSRDEFGRQRRAPLFRETLPNGVAYDVLEIQDNRGYWDNTNEYTVPPGHFFMMGDNRDNSTDSRDMSRDGVGFVPYENLVGRAEVIFFSISEGVPPWQVWRWPVEARWGRFLQKIR
jgi:signal peptidase I